MILRVASGHVTPDKNFPFMFPSTSAKTVGLPRRFRNHDHLYPQLTDKHVQIRVIRAYELITIDMSLISRQFAHFRFLFLRHYDLINNI